MQRTFTSGPAIAPDGPLHDPPIIEGRPARPVTVAEPAPSFDPLLKKHTSTGQVTVEHFIRMLQLAVADDPAVAGFSVESEGCDCVGAADGIEVDLRRAVVVVTRPQ